jgi:phosphoglycolate phosphatase-like HAD superfamily hydrolase
VRAASAAGVVPLGVVAPGDDRAATEAALFEAGAACVLGSLDELEGLLGSLDEPGGGLGSLGRPGRLS